TPLTPTNSGQPLHPTHCRGCWHVVSRSFLARYRPGTSVLDQHWFFPNHRDLRSEDLHHSRGIATSDFRQLLKIPYCCLSDESGPCLSPSVADHPLRSATHRCFGEPLPHHLANATRVHL